MSQVKVINTRKSKKDIIAEKAYMILSDMAFDYANVNGKNFLVVTNLKDLKQQALFIARKDDFMYAKGNMSKQNIYKAMFIVEKNKAMLIGGIKKCQNIHQTK